MLGKSIYYFIVAFYRIFKQDGTKLQYQILKVVGNGTFGVVYKVKLHFFSIYIIFIILGLIASYQRNSCYKKSVLR